MTYIGGNGFNSYIGGGKRGGGGGATSSFKVSQFTSNKQIVEKGVPVSSITFDWVYSGGTPTSQSIAPLVGTIPVGNRTTNLTGQNITTDTTFTLSASDGTTNATKTTVVTFLYPIYWGLVDSLTPVQAQIKATNKLVANYINFDATLNIVDRRTMVCTPMTNPVVDIIDKRTGQTMLDSFTKYDNIMITMADSVNVPCRVYIKTNLEYTYGTDYTYTMVF